MRILADDNDLFQTNRIYCFGAGGIGKDFCDFISGKGYDLRKVVFVDNNIKLHNTYREIESVNIPIISKNDMIDMITEKDILVIATLACAEIYEELEKEERLKKQKVQFAQLILSRQIKLSDLPANIDDIQNKIPKIIHYCWFGGNKIPKEMQDYIDGWRRLCPDYEIIRWDESNYDISKNKYMRQAYEQKKWGFVPDYARLDILYEYGGIYLDTDIELKKSLDELLAYDAFFAIGANLKVNTGSGFGTIPHNLLIAQMRDVYEPLEFIDGIGKINATPCPEYQFKPLKKFGFKLNGEKEVLDNILILPLNIMGAYNHYLDEYMIDENTIGVHYSKRSWHDEKMARWAEESVELLNGLTR